MKVRDLLEKEKHGLIEYNFMNDIIKHSRVTPKIDNPNSIKSETKTMQKIAEDTNEIKNNTKPSFWGTFWGNLLFVVIGSLVTLVVEHFIF